MPAGWDRLAVDGQAGSGESVLGHFRKALAARRRLAKSLADGVDWLESPAGVLCYSRGPLTVACNFTGRPVRLEVGGRLRLGSDPLVRVAGGRLRLPPNSAAWLHRFEH